VRFVVMAYPLDGDCQQLHRIVEAFIRYLNVLKTNHAPLSEKHIALDYLVHLLSDLHLPLHVGFLDDLGGTKVTFQGKAQTLHELWDSGILDTENRTARAMATLLDEECDPNDRIAWQAGTPTDWANESLALTIQYVYPYLNRAR